jgi:hypothetical protein
VLGRNRPVATLRGPAACHAQSASWATAWRPAPVSEAWPRRVAGRIGEGRRGWSVGHGHSAERRHQLIGGPERHSARGLTRFEIKIRIQTRSNDFKFSSNFDSFKRYLTVLKKFQIKYGWKEIEIRNNFPYRNFSRFEMEFELKNQRTSMSWNSLKKLENLDFDKIWPASSLVHHIAMKNKFLSNGD